MAQQSKALSGRVYNLTFNDGPTAGKTYEHTFAPDGTVKFKEAGAAPGGEQSGGGEMPATKYAAFEIGQNLYLVSYLSSHGYTLTVAMNLDSKRLHGFASGNNEWHPLGGTVEVVK